MDFSRTWNCSQSADVVDLIADRVIYIDGLRFLQPGWISNGFEVTGFTPSDESVEMAKKILALVATSADQENNWDIGGMIFCPLISGGISMEARQHNDQKAIILNIENRGVVEVISRDGLDWSEYEVAFECAEENIKELFKNSSKPSNGFSIKI